MRFRRRALSALAGPAVLAGGLLMVTGQASGQDPGLGVGEKALSFELQDASGASRSLTDLQASGHLALVFYRSADW